MRSQIQSLETQRLVENKKIERMKNAAAQMEKLAAQNKSVLEQYRTRVMILERERKVLEQEYSKQKANSLTVLKNRIGDIEKLKTRYEEYRDVRARDYEAAETKEDKAIQEYEAAKKAYDQAENDYQAALTYQQKLEKSFVELRTLKDQIDKERNHKNKYFLNEELKDRLRLHKTEPLSYRNLAAELTKAFNSLDSARETLAEKEAALDKARAEAESLKSELEMVERNRREKILAKL